MNGVRDGISTEKRLDGGSEAIGLCLSFGAAVVGSGEEASQALSWDEAEGGWFPARNGYRFQGRQAR